MYSIKLYVVLYLCPWSWLAPLGWSWWWAPLQRYSTAALRRKTETSCKIRIFKSKRGSPTLFASCSSCFPWKIFRKTMWHSIFTNVGESLGRWCFIFSIRANVPELKFPAAAQKFSNRALPNLPHRHTSWHFTAKNGKLSSPYLSPFPQFSTNSTFPAARNN